MSTAELTPTGNLRDRQKAETRRLILDAAGRLLQRDDLDALSFAAIAEEAGVRERTVYRHFPNREALIGALWGWLDPRIGVGSFPKTEAELVAFPQRVFPAFDQNENLMRAFWTTPHGREFRLQVNAQRQAAFRAATASAADGLDAREKLYLCAAAQLLYSGAAWQTMKDYWGLNGEEAGKAAAFALELMFDAARRRGAGRKKTGKGKP